MPRINAKTDDRPETRNTAHSFNYVRYTHAVK